MIIERVSSIVDVSIKGIRAASDSRGTFTKFHPTLDLQTSIDSIAISQNPHMGTIRGLHFQLEPFAEEKLITCLQGSIFDVILDLRPDSLTFGKWMAFELSSDSRTLVYLPKGVAHGFQTLSPNTIVQYCISAPYSPQCAMTINPLEGLTIDWPMRVSSISDKDKNGSSFEEASMRYINSLTSQNS